MDKALRLLRLSLFSLACFGSGAALLHADTVAGPPPGQKILVITGSDSMLDFTRFIQQNGNQWGFCSADMNAGTGWITQVQAHTVTVSNLTVPPLATLQTYDQVWDLRFSAGNCQGTVAGCGANGISAAQQADYLSYIAGGGSLFLMGDNGGYPGRNSPIQAIANAVDSAGAFQTSVITTNNDTQQGAYIDLAAATAAENFQSDYRDLTGTNRWVAAQYNGLVASWGNAYPILKDQLTGYGTAFAFDCGNMKPAYQAGKLEIVFDWQMMGGGGQVGYCPPNAYTGVTFGSNERFWENSIDFLVHGNACATPTFTRTATPSPTRTATRTATPTASPTATPSPSPTASPTATPSPTPSATPSASPTLTASPSATLTATATATRTASPTVTVSSTATPTATPTHTASPPASATDTPSITATPTATLTRTPTATVTVTATVTATPSATASVTDTFSPTDTPSVTASPTATLTRSPTSSATPTDTDTPIYTPTATPTASPTLTATPSFTDTATRTATPTPSPSATPSPTRTATPSATASATATPSVTVTSSFTVSPTITVTPVPVPFEISVRVYNSAGELVRLVYEGASQVLPTDLVLDKDAFVPGLDAVKAPLGGRLSNGASSLSWDGLNDSGQAVSAGTYVVKLEARDPYGQVSSLAASVAVLPVASQAWLRLSNAAGELVWQQILSGPATGFSLSDSTVALAGDGTGNSATALRIQVALASGGSQLVDWDGRGAGGRLVASGSYSLLLSSSEPGRSAQVQVAKLTVLRGADADLLGSALLGPNPARDVNQATLRYTPAAGLVATAEIFSLDGSRVAGASDPQQSGVLRLGLQGLSGGVYVCVLRVGEQKRVLKLAVVK